jgi:hypothetical protein
MKVNDIKVFYCELLLDIMKFCSVSLNTVKYSLVLGKTKRFC